MTIAIGMKMAEGIVLAADSTVSNLNEGTCFHGAQKIFYPGNLDKTPGQNRQIGFAVFGSPLIKERSYREFCSRIETWLDQQEETGRQVKVVEVAEALKKIVEEDLPGKLDEDTKGGIILGGFDAGEYDPKLYLVKFLSGKILIAEAYPGKSLGLVSSGQLAAIHRMLYGTERNSLIAYFTSVIYAKSKERTAKTESLDKACKDFIEECFPGGFSLDRLLLAPFPFDWLPSILKDDLKQHPRKHQLRKWEGTNVSVRDIISVVGGSNDLPIREALDLAFALIYTGSKLAKFGGSTQTVGGKIELAAITRDRGFRFATHKGLTDQLDA